MTASPCSVCEQVAGRVTAPGGPIHDDGLWLVSHHTGAHTDPGELIVQVRRHCESLGELTAAEASAPVAPPGPAQFASRPASGDATGAPLANHADTMPHHRSLAAALVLVGTD